MSFSFFMGLKGIIRKFVRFFCISPDIFTPDPSHLLSFLLISIIPEGYWVFRAGTKAEQKSLFQILDRPICTLRLRAVLFLVALIRTATINPFASASGILTDGEIVEVVYIIGHIVAKMIEIVLGLMRSWWLLCLPLLSQCVTKVSPV